MNLQNEFFQETNFCYLCGSQRCDKTLIWVEGCQHYKEWLNKKFNDFINNKEKAEFKQIWT